MFNVYVQKLTGEALDKARGVVVRRERIKAIKYADDQTVSAESEEELQCVIQSTVGVGKDFEMKKNVGKTKVMKIARNEGYIK